MKVRIALLALALSAALVALAPTAVAPDCGRVYERCPMYAPGVGRISDCNGHTLVWLCFFP